MDRTRDGKRVIGVHSLGWGWGLNWDWHRLGWDGQIDIILLCVVYYRMGVGASSGETKWNKKRERREEKRNEMRKKD
jgi:hypothetical protein